VIPHFNLSLVIPPFVGGDATDPDAMSPYDASMTELVDRFGTSDERAEILEGLLDYREELRQLGIVNGFQWIAGSFCEHVEIIRSRPPGDVDIVTFAYRHISDDAQWFKFFNFNQQVFSPFATKKKFKADAYYIDLGIDAELIVDTTAYWSGLFSHQRNSHLWKGMLKIPLVSDDAAARAML
jgi:hypothetical protein